MLFVPADPAAQAATPKARSGWILLLAALFLFLPVQAAAPGEVLNRITSAELDPERAVALDNYVIELGEARVAVEAGTLIPARAIDGRTVELVFVGQARFRIEPPDEIEAGQLELFTGERFIDAPLEAAVLVIADQRRVDELLDRFPPRKLRPALLARAEMLRRELAHTGQSGIEAGAFRALVGDDAFSSYFGIWCRSIELGDFVYQLDPEDAEPLTLASFVPLGISGWERRRLERHIRIQQRKGYWLGMSVEDLGAWDIWLSSRWMQGEGRTLPGHRGFETEHYELDVTLNRRNLRLEGTATLSLVAQDDGRRTISLELYRDLVVRRVLDGQGRELFFFRSRGDVIVVLPEPSRVGDELTLEVDYGGRVVKWVGRQIFDLEDTDNWYPHCGTVDRATYDVTLHWPRKYELVASGRRVDSGRDGHLLWERRKLDIPSIAFSFVVGDLHIETRRIGHVDVKVGFAKSTPRRLTPTLRTEIVDTLGQALAYFEEIFGPYPLDELSVVSLPRRYSQSYLGFVTLTDSVVRNQVGGANDARWVRDTTVAHELAHQWWGNQVGWASYRDQWLSEAMANYSALLFYARMHGEGAGFLADMSAGWRDSLSQTTSDGVPIESLGPIVLGGRLSSSMAANGYRAIVYRKGAVVLAMLARAVGEEPFLEMLGSLAQAASNRVVTTEEFLAAIEHMSGLQLGGFARQYIYGTGIPDVYYDYRSARTDDSRWVVTGEARRVVLPDQAHRIDRSASGLWSVRREINPGSVDDATMLMVPYSMTIETPQGVDPAGHTNGRPAAIVDRLFMSGREHEFRIESDYRPIDLRLDPRGEILARFYSADEYPKRVLRYKALDHLTAGRRDEAEQVYLQALKLESGPAPRVRPVPWLRNAERDEQLENARIILALARIYIEQGREGEALARLDAADELLGQAAVELRMERDVLRSRIDIGHADYEVAYRRLKKTFRIAAPKRPVGWNGIVWRLRLNSERLAMTEAFALHAIASFETGHEEELRWALQEARQRGTDVSVLDAAIAGAGPGESDSSVGSP